MRGRRGEERGGKGSEGRLPPLKFKSGYTLLVCVCPFIVKDAGLC